MNVWGWLMRAGMLVASLNASAQRDSIFDPQVTVGYAYHLPSGDMANRFGNNSALTLGFHAKFKSNWYAGVHGNFLFGGKVIQEEGFLQN